MTDDETVRAVQALLNELSLPPEEEVKRLQAEVERLEARRGADARALLKTESESSSLIGKLALACGVLAILLLWFVHDYLEARGALKDVCKFVSREAVNLPDEAIGMGESADTLGGANDVCFEQNALP